MFFSQYFSFPLSIPFHHCSILIHLPPTLYNVFLPVLQFSPVCIIRPTIHTHLHRHVSLNGNTNEAWEPSETSSISHVENYWTKSSILVFRLRIRATRLLACYLLLTYLLTYSMGQRPSWESSRFYLVKKFPTFYATRRFITAFTSARHLSISCASLIQFIPPHIQLPEDPF